MSNLSPFNFPKRVPPWIVDLLKDWSTLDMREGAPRSEEMVVLVDILAGMLNTHHPYWQAIQAHFRPWVGGNQGQPAAVLFMAVEHLAQGIDAELGDW